MNVVDSSAWLEYFADTAHAELFAEPIQDVDHLIVPTITIFEVVRRSLQQHREEAAVEVAAYMRRGTTVALDEELALSAARLGVEMNLPMADCIILATARRYGATLWTMDQDFEGIDGVRYYRRP